MLLWIVGAEGLLGRALTALCLSRGIACHPSGKREADITSLEGLRVMGQALQPTHIVNCAAFTDVDGAESEPERAYAINAMGPKNLALAAGEVGAHLTHVSTDYVFNGRGEKLYVEEDACDPVNIYGKSKLAGEHEALSILPTACVVRTSWLFGKGGKNFISTLLGWLQTRESVRIVSDQVNRPTYVDDVAGALLSLLDCKGVLHFANGHPLSRYQIAVDLLAAAEKRGMPCACRELIPAASSEFPATARRPLHTPLSTDKFTRMTGMIPRSWNEILEEYWEPTCGKQSVS